jgi:sigma-E factor negative regulatory protein RseA
MSDKLNESLSALMDNEVNELELHRLFAELSGGTGLRQTWVRFNLAQQAMHGHAVAHLDLDVSQRVQAALGGTDKGNHRPAFAAFRHRMVRPFMSFAVAASVAATVVVGGQQLAQIGAAGPENTERSVATSASSVGMLNSLGASAIQASYGTQPLPVLQPATRSAYQQLAQQRMRKYMQEHAEQASLNSPQGLVPFSRVPQILQ